MWMDTTEMSTGYCFDDYNETAILEGEEGFENAADENGTIAFDPNTGFGQGFRFDDDFGGIRARDSGDLGATLTPNLGSTQTDKTLALLVMHYDQDDDDILDLYGSIGHNTSSLRTIQASNSNEIFQQNAIVISR